MEHAARTKLVRLITEREDENGYSVSADYMASLNHKERNHRESEVGMLANDVFCSDRVHKHGRPSDMPTWVLIEPFSFGSPASLCLFCANRWYGGKMRDGRHGEAGALKRFRLVFIGATAESSTWQSTWSITWQNQCRESIQ